MDYKQLLEILGYTPKNNTKGVFSKTYKNSKYIIEVDTINEKIDFGQGITAESATTQNFSQDENWVVLECVDRLLEKGYKPEDIILEKTYKTGHGTSGRLDILVKKNGNAFLMIECKIRGKEYDKELKNIYKDGGQLFTYFQQDRSTDYIVLYASHVTKGTLEYTHDIIKVEETYKETGNVKEFFDRWNKITKKNGLFESWVTSYDFKSKALTPNDLKEIRESDSSFIFNRFLEILRHNTVSDKPNAFNKIFTLFLCKIYDEGDKNSDDQLDFQWLEGEDDHISFQVRLTDLYKKGMNRLLEKDITDLSNDEFNEKFGVVDEKIRIEILKELNKIRLQKNNEFAIKEVFDQETFDDNAIVLKEIVELLQVFKIRYTKKQPFLGDFFELLLTTGLKQESGQFFTPVPVARFICKSLPLDSIIQHKLQQGNPKDLLPTTIDYAAGSGHFLTESMEEIQNIIGKIDTTSLKPQIKKEVEPWKTGTFDWAYDYMYGIEKDYRLVKTAKVGCFLHGDGIANVVHGDGLDSFENSKHYRGKLTKVDKNNAQNNKEFDIVISNPPYSVSSFKNNLNTEQAKKDFLLYDKLTDSSSEIECLFIERTKQLLKEGGIAAIILPSSILTNTGIYSKAREIIFMYFDIISIVELGSNTFMATGTNTVILFMRRKSDYEAENIKSSIENAFATIQDMTIGGIESAISKYVSHVWEGLDPVEYLKLLSGTVSENIAGHELYQSYENKIKSKNKEDLLQQIIATEKEKMLYFVLTYKQRIVHIKTGEKDIEKKFLGYEFSFRKGSEGIHPIQRGKLIDDCTQLFDPDSYMNGEKANSYIYSAFQGHYDLPIHESLLPHISYIDLVDTINFDRPEMEKIVSLSAKKKINFDKIWETSNIVLLGNIADIQKGTSITQRETHIGEIPVIAGGQSPSCFHNKSNRDGNIITVSASGAYAGFIAHHKNPIFASDCNTIKSKDEKVISTELIYHFLSSIQQEIYLLQRGQAQPHVYGDDLSKIKIPVPSFDIQKKIIKEIEHIEKKYDWGKLEILKSKVSEEAERLYKKYTLNRISGVTENPVYGANESAKAGDKNNDYRYIRITDITDDGKLNDDWKTANKIDPKYILQDGDFLFARSGATAGKTLLYKSSLGKAIYAGYLILFRPLQDKIIPNFLNFILKSSTYKEWVIDKRKGAAQPNINAQQFGSFEIPLPPLSEQEKTLTEIGKIEAEITKLEAELATIPAQKEAILKKYL